MHMNSYWVAPYNSHSHIEPLYKFYRGHLSFFVFFNSESISCASWSYSLVDVHKTNRTFHHHFHLPKTECEPHHIVIVISSCFGDAYNARQRGHNPNNGFVCPSSMTVLPVEIFVDSNMRCVYVCGLCMSIVRLYIIDVVRMYWPVFKWTKIEFRI